MRAGKGAWLMAGSPAGCKALPGLSAGMAALRWSGWPGVWLAFGLLLFLVATVTVQAQNDGTLEGQVVNGTAGGPSIGEGITVTLHVFQGEDEIDTRMATTNDGGSFRFEGLATGDGLEYWPEVTYLGVPYNTDESYQFEGGQMSLAATVTVYETTDDDSAIRLDQVHMIAESFEQVLRISEVHLFGNQGDRTYVGRDRATVTIPLPQDAVGLALDEGTSSQRFSEIEGAVIDSAPVPPGQETSLVFFSYHVVVTGQQIPVERIFAYPVASLNMLVAQPGLALESSQLEAHGTEPFQDREYAVYGVQDLAANTPLAFTFSLLPGATADQAAPAAAGDQAPAETALAGQQGLLRWLGFALAGLGMVGVLVYSAASRGSTVAATSAPGLTGDPEARRLLAELADLEEAFEAGRIDRASYEHQRAAGYDALKGS